MVKHPEIVLFLQWQLYKSLVNNIEIHFEVSDNTLNLMVMVCTY